MPRCPRGINLGDAVAEPAVDGGARFDPERLAESSLEEFDRGRRVLRDVHKLAEVTDGGGLQAGRPSRPRRNPLQHRAGAHRLASRIEIVGQIYRSTSLRFGGRLAETERELHELCCRGRRSSEQRVARGRVHGHGRGLVPTFDGEGEMARALLRPSDRLRQATMGSATLGGGGRREHPRGKERMRESDQAPLALRDLLALGRLQIAADRAAQREPHGLLARVVQRRGRDQYLARRRTQRPNAPGDERLDVGGVPRGAWGTGWSGSATAERLSFASVSAGRQDRTRYDRSSARRTTSRQTVVLPIPASPSSRSTAKRSRAESRNSSASESSPPRPTMFATPEVLCIS